MESAGPGSGCRPECEKGYCTTGRSLRSLKTVVGQLLRGLESRFPWLATWTGGRLDIELPALFMSLTIHGLLLAGLAFAGFQVASGVAATGVPVGDGGQPGLASDSTFQDLDQSAEPPAPMASAGSFAPNAGAHDHLGAEHRRRRAGFGRTGGLQPRLGPRAGQAGRAAGDRGRRAHRDHAGPDRLDQAATAPRSSAASKGRSTGSPSRSSATWRRDRPWSSGRSTPRAASRPSGSG